MAWDRHVVKANLYLLLYREGLTDDLVACSIKYI